MSSSRRPWYPWYPKDFNQDEKVRMLSDDAELVYRRALDVLWQANDQQMPSNCLALANALARGWSTERFKNAWDEIQKPEYELLKTTDDGKWVYSKRLKLEAEKIASLCKIRRKSASKGGQASAQARGQANAKQKVEQTSSHTDTDTDTDNINNNPPTPHGGNGSVLKSYPYPDWLNKNLWADFHKMRSRIKKPITTERTIKGLITSLKKLMDDGHCQEDIIQMAIDKCWLSFYPPKNTGRTCANDDGKEWIV
jgi:hypothetical protein